MPILSMLKRFTSRTLEYLIQKAIILTSKLLKQYIELSSTVLRRTKHLSNLVLWTTKQSKKVEKIRKLFQANVFRLSLFILLLMNIQNLCSTSLSLRLTSELIRDKRKKTNLLVKDLFLILGVLIFLCQKLNASTIGSIPTKETMERQLSRTSQHLSIELLTMSKLKIFKI